MTRAAEGRGGTGKTSQLRSDRRKQLSVLLQLSSGEHKQMATARRRRLCPMKEKTTKGRAFLQMSIENNKLSTYYLFSMVTWCLTLYICIFNLIWLGASPGTHFVFYCNIHWCKKSWKIFRILSSCIKCFSFPQMLGIK